jgi:hypothetical protein
VQDRRDRVCRRRPRERPPPRQRLVEDCPQREDVRPRVRLQAPRLLRRQITRRPHHGARHRLRPLGPGLGPVPPGELREPEVEDLREAVRRQEQVLGLEIAVQDAPGVCGLQPTADLHRRLHRRSQRQRPAPQPLPKALPLQQLEDDVRLPVARPHVEHRQHVRVRQGRDGPRFVLESPEPLRARRPVRRDHLDRDVPRQARVAGTVDCSHPPGPDEAEDLVRPEPVTGRQWHGRLAGVRGQPKL